MGLENQNKKIYSLEKKKGMAFCWEIVGESIVLFSSTSFAVILASEGIQGIEKESYLTVSLLIYIFMIFLIGVAIKIISRNIWNSSLKGFQKMMDKGREGGIY